jgi:uncharacterized cupin superfamily protein
MFSLEAFDDLLNFPKGEFKPKPTTLTPGQEEALQPLWESIDGRTKVGIWDCKTGHFTADRTEMTELCHILCGSATVINHDGTNTRKVSAGDLLVLPMGWRGEWIVHEEIRKTYVLISA